MFHKLRHWLVDDKLLQARLEAAMAQMQLARNERDFQFTKDELARVRVDFSGLIHGLEAQRNLDLADRRKERSQAAVRIASLEAENRQLAVRVDVAQANLEWSRLMFNKGEQERSVLMQHVLERPMQAFSIDRVHTPPPPPDADGIAQPRDGADAAIDAAAAALGISFDDVGDDVANALGIEHDDDGIVHETKNR